METLQYRSEPEVCLVNYTPRPIDTMIWAFNNMHNPISSDYIPEYSEEEQIEFLEMLKKIPHQTVLEFVSTVWYIKGSRAFQTQLIRTRQASYSIQSLRVAKANPEFYTEFHEQKYGYRDAFSYYERLIKEGVSKEQARAVLPLAIMSPITMSINFRSLTHMLSQRLCRNTQGEFRKVAVFMKKEIKEKISPLLAYLLHPVCEDLEYCPSPVPCGEYPGKKYGERWIKG